MIEIIPTLVCLFIKEDIKFKTFTLSSLSKLTNDEKRIKVLDIYKHNISTLQLALNKCKELNIKSYRVSSDLLPKFTYVKENKIISNLDIVVLEKLLRKIRNHKIILSLHPDQFVVLNSPKDLVILNSVKEIHYHLFLSKCLNINSINIHIGGLYDNKKNSIDRFIVNCRKYFTDSQLSKITIENDEKSFSIDDILYISNNLNIRPVFDIHHHRCYNIGKDNLDIERYMIECLNIWKRLNYDYFQIHISSPRDDRYKTLKGSMSHSDYINKEDIIDFGFLNPFKMNLVIDIEAKAKELAVKEFTQYIRYF